MDCALSFVNKYVMLRVNFFCVQFSDINLVSYKRGQCIMVHAQFWEVILSYYIPKFQLYMFLLYK